MGLFDVPKMKPLRLSKMRIKRKGERTLTQSDKKKVKKKKGNKCQRCRKAFSQNLLVVHHRKAVAGYKSKGLELPQYEMYTKRKKKAHYDREKNLMVLCPTCHKKVHNEESDKDKIKKKKAKKRNSGLNIPRFRI